MKVKELLDLISQKTENAVNQSLLAKGLGVTRQTINNRIRNNSEITISELQKMEKFLGIKLYEACKNNNEMKEVYYYPEVFASCGNGIITFSEEKEVVSLPRMFFKKTSVSNNYSMIHARGDSMSPCINDGDILLIEHSENTQINDNKIYVFCYKSEIFVKRLSKNLDEIMIKSDNPNYNLRIIRNDDMNDIKILGQVVGIIRNI